MNDTSAIEACAACWIAQRDGESWTELQQRELEAWLDESALHRVAYLRLNAAWTRADRLRALRTSEPLARSSPAGRPLTLSPTVIPAGFWRFGLAAAIAAMVAITLSLSGDPSGTEAKKLFSTPIGARETVALIDGTRLTLNTSTQLSARINDRERTVWLDEGEAYFDVAYDLARPFVIRAGDRSVTVVGTKFTLRRDGDRLKVDVIEGRVLLQGVQGSQTLLARDDTGVSEGRNLLVSKRSEIQSIAATSWLEGRLVFDQTTLAEATAEFNRYNPKKLVVADAAAGAIRIGGSFEAKNVEGFAHLVQSGFGLKVDVYEDQIVIAGVQK